jgi:hypothetical protein
MKLSATLVKIATDPPASKPGWWARHNPFGSGSVTDFTAPAVRDTFNAKTQKRVQVVRPEGYRAPGDWFPHSAPETPSDVPVGRTISHEDLPRTKLDMSPRYGSAADRARGAHGVKGKAGVHGDVHRPSGQNAEVRFNSMDANGALAENKQESFGGRAGSIETLTPTPGTKTREYSAPSVSGESDKSQFKPWVDEAVGAQKRMQTNQANKALLESQKTSSLAEKLRAMTLG